jgi:hypothetical protein
MTAGRLFILVCLLIISGGGYVASKVPEYAAKKIEIRLAEAGFKKAKVGNIHFARQGIVAGAISLDAGGIDGIETILIEMDWVARRARHIEVIKPSISYLLKDKNFFLAASVFTVPDLPPVPITVRDATIDLSTALGILRLQGGLTLTPGDAGHDVAGHLTSRQYGLGFETRWTGKIEPGGTTRLSAQIEDGQIKTPMLQIHRAYGWIDITTTPGILSFLGEIESGSGKISGLPVQDVYLAIRGEKDRLSLIGRSYFSGEKNTRLSLDSEISPEQSIGQIVLQTQTPRSLLSKLFQEKIIPDAPASLKDTPSFTLRLRHQPERRFEGGPLPFELSLDDNAARRLNGNILFYPDEYTWRGTVQGDADLTQDVSRWLGVEKEKSGRGFFRIEKNMGQWVPGAAP